MSAVRAGGGWVGKGHGALTVRGAVVFEKWGCIAVGGKTPTASAPDGYLLFRVPAGYPEQFTAFFLWREDYQSDKIGGRRSVSGLAVKSFAVVENR